MRTLETGHRYFFRKSKRVDEFAHKRYTNPECEKWASIVVMGRVVEQRGEEVKIVIEDTGMKAPDPKDGETIVLPVGFTLCTDEGYWSLEKYGKPKVQIGVWE